MCKVIGLMGNLYEIFPFCVEENHRFPRAVPPSNFTIQLIATTLQDFAKNFFFPKTSSFSGPQLACERVILVRRNPCANNITM